MDTHDVYSDAAPRANCIASLNPHARVGRDVQWHASCHFRVQGIESIEFSRLAENRSRAPLPRVLFANCGHGRVAATPSTRPASAP
jgi:hypothetical protein